MEEDLCVPFIAPPMEILENCSSGRRLAGGARWKVLRNRFLPESPFLLAFQAQDGTGKKRGSGLAKPHPWGRVNSSKRRGPRTESAGGEPGKARQRRMVMAFVSPRHLDFVRRAVGSCPRKGGVTVDTASCLRSIHPAHYPFLSVHQFTFRGSRTYLQMQGLTLLRLPATPLYFLRPGVTCNFDWSQSTYIFTLAAGLH